MLETRRKALMAALEDGDPQVRIAAAASLEALEPLLHLQQLLGGLAVADRGHRIHCLFALEKVRAPGVPEALLRLLEDPDPDVRAAAVQVLGARAEARALPELAKRLRDPEAAVRMYAAEVLGAFRDARLVPYLAAVLRDEDSGVVAAAATSLGSIGAAESEKYLLALLRDSRAPVRRAAAVALGRLEIKDEP
ncbi:HEAT repeat-containing protein [Geoalkalibacter ferrihydriticus]|uniref:HEAT repeat-containing protein n=1 Tax=Geoalkalibacter ferrihydriticus TaxID=392333 RepID=A0A1G9IK51_9BACT|nr:HEAT repeat domain-containing protein [Geoalkalibacter ferrihydriticus]SDL25466.1 HEAT repeat-containing protein [Geoalkalibacter ferrihydriticus]